MQGSQGGPIEASDLFAEQQGEIREEDGEITRDKEVVAKMGAFWLWDLQHTLRVVNIRNKKKQQNTKHPYSVYITNNIGSVLNCGFL